MATETAERIMVPRIQIYGAGDLNRLNTFDFEGQVGPEIVDFDKPYKDIHGGSIALRDQATLFQAYLKSELGEIELPEDIGRITSYLFDNVGRGNVTDDACDYNGGDSSMRKVKDSDRRVRWIVHPKGFKNTGDGWEAHLGEDSNVKHILVPATGYVELTVDGSYRPDTGTPFSTVDSREQAEKSWINRGFDPKFARKAVSYFYSREEGNGTAAVDRWYYVEDVGRFSVSADEDPDDWDSFIGGFPASRPASGASPASKGIVVVDE